MSIKMFNNQLAGRGVIYPPLLYQDHFVAFMNPIEKNVKEKFEEKFEGIFRDFFD